MTAPSPWQRLCQAPVAEQKRIQNAQLRRYVREELYPFSAHYRKAFDTAGVRPQDIRTVDDLRRLPFTTKADLLAAQSDPATKRDFVLVPTPASIKAHWPFMRKLALVLGGARAREILRYRYTPHFVTFTTGRSSEPVVFTYTPHDLEILGEAGGRMFDVHGLKGREVRVVNAFPFAPHLAFWAASFASFQTGQFTVPTGGGKVMGTEGNLAMLERLKATVLIATPGFAYHLLRRARNAGSDLSSMDTIVLGAEKVTPGLKAKMATCLAACGASNVTISGTYGFTEARMAFSECPAGHDESPGYHLYPDLNIVEVIDPDTLEPVGDGEDGELVFSTISGHGTCVMRYRTGDMAVGGVTWEPCPWCGRTVPRISSELRRVSDRHALNLTKIKGTLVDLSHMGTVLSSHAEVEEWQVVLTKKNDDPYELDEFEVRVALANDVDAANFQRQIGEELARATEVHPNRVSVHSLPEMLDFLGMETEMKEKRYLDLRPKA